MGIANITADSFSDGGRFLECSNAVQHALRLAEESAELLDLGAESTRPGSEGISAKEQLRRLLPVLQNLRPRTEAVLSIDTRSSEVARACIAEGADVINDVSGLRDDPAIAEVCAETGAGLVLMHMRGTPATMQRQTNYEDLVSEVHNALQHSVALALKSGLIPDQILVDPGIGFGKSFEQNYELLRSPKRFRKLAAGVLLGPSRKGFTGEFSGLPADQRQYSTAATVAIAVLNGADVLRVHDVAAMRQVTDICDRYMELTDEHD